MNGERHNGLFTIFTDVGTFTVYCDMTSEPHFIWTLFFSFALKNRLANDGAFYKKAYFIDSPVQEDEPNWEKYRLGLKRMEWLYKRSSLWRATCAFSKHGVDHRDYLRANLSELNPVIFNGREIQRKVG